MADFWIIEYKERIHEDDAPHDETHKFLEWQTCAIDIDSVVTIEKSTHGVDYLWLEVDNGWKYLARILKEVTKDEVIAEMKSRYRTHNKY